MKSSVLGVDLGMNVFHPFGVDEHGRAVRSAACLERLKSIAIVSNGAFFVVSRNA
jgi:hypothetical protein